jgi:hypothetical protein
MKLQTAFQDVTQGETNTPPPEVKDLVCQRCWEDLFGTHQFRMTCTYNVKAVESNPVAEHRVLLSQLEVSRGACIWCSLFYHHISDIDGNLEIAR